METGVSRILSLIEINKHLKYVTIAFCTYQLLPALLFLSLRMTNANRKITFQNAIPFWLQGMTNLEGKIKSFRKECRK